MKNSVFYKIYFSVIAVFGVFLILGLVWFNGFLKDFEANQPQNIAQGIIENHLKTNGIKRLHDNYGLALSPYETEQTIGVFYDQYISGKELTLGSLSLKPDNVDVAFTVCADKERILDIYINRNEKGKYFVSETKINPTLLKSYTVNTDETTEISVNGIPVSAEQRQNVEPTEAVKSLLQANSGTAKQSIRLENMLCEPCVLAGSGDTKSTLIAADTVFSSEQSFPERQKIEQLVFSGTSAYASYMFNLVPISDVGAHFDTSSEFYRNLRRTDVHYTLEYVSNRVEDFKISDMHKYNDSLFSCRVTFTNVLTRRGKEHLDYFNKYIYVKSMGNGYKIIDMQNAE